MCIHGIGNGLSNDQLVEIHRGIAYVFMCEYARLYVFTYGVATMSRLLKIMGLLCRISSLL